MVQWAMSDVATRADIDPVLQEVKRRLVARYGDRLDRVVLFGSRARGDHRDDSDYDIAVFLHDLNGNWPESERLAGLSWEIWQDTNAVLSMKPFAPDAWHEDTLLMRHIHRDGMEL